MGAVFYPQGGYDDFAGEFDSILACYEHLNCLPDLMPDMWAHIVLNDKIIMRYTFYKDWSSPEEKINWIQETDE